jgi:hypothetical protein
MSRFSRLSFPLFTVFTLAICASCSSKVGVDGVEPDPIPDLPVPEGIPQPNTHPEPVIEGEQQLIAEFDRELEVKDIVVDDAHVYLGVSALPAELAVITPASIVRVPKTGGGFEHVSETSKAIYDIDLDNLRLYWSQERVDDIYTLKWIDKQKLGASGVIAEGFRAFQLSVNGNHLHYAEESAGGGSPLWRARVEASPTPELVVHLDSPYVVQLLAGADDTLYVATDTAVIAVDVPTGTITHLATNEGARELQLVRNRLFWSFAGVHWIDLDAIDQGPHRVDTAANECSGGMWVSHGSVICFDTEAPHVAIREYAIDGTGTALRAWQMRLTEMRSAIAADDEALYWVARTPSGANGIYRLD